MQKNELTKEEKSIQNILNKLIAEEYIANMLYKNLYNKILFQKQEILADIESFNLFNIIANDEYEDHYRKLVSYAVANGFTFPISLKDLEKNASASVKQLNGIKDKQSSEYYVKEAIKSELAAIKMYEEAIVSKQIPYELTAICTQIYYDEIDHLDKLQTLINALQCNAVLRYA